MSVVSINDHRMWRLTGEKAHDDTDDQGGENGEHRVPKVTHSVESSDRISTKLIQNKITA